MAEFRKQKWDRFLRRLLRGVIAQIFVYTRRYVLAVIVKILGMIELNRLRKQAWTNLRTSGQIIVYLATADESLLFLEGTREEPKFLTTASTYRGL